MVLTMLIANVFFRENVNHCPTGMKMFAGLISRWTIPFECPASRASKQAFIESNPTRCENLRVFGRKAPPTWPLWGVQPRVDLFPWIDLRWGTVAGIRPRYVSHL